MHNCRQEMYNWQLSEIVGIDDYDTSRAKQRASVCWIVQKAHKNKVPADLQEPYYKDYEGQDHPKPAIVHKLSNAEFYCSALANIYGDPNFHNLSHWHIIQALARKGVYVAEPTDVALTETVLIQTTPIKMSAHLAVIEAMMTLYIREVVVAERVVQAMQRVAASSSCQDGIRTPQDQEEALVQWVEHVTQALQSRIHQVHPSQDQELPVFPKIQDLSDLSDGIGLAALIAFYCPQDLSWEDIAVADPPSMADSLYNIGLVIKFCCETLPYNPCLLTKEDIVYMHSSVKQNIVAFVAELFFLMELEPVSCVSAINTRRSSSKFIQLSSPGMKPAGVPSVVKRSHSMNLNDVSDSRSRSENAPSSHNSDNGGRESSMSDGQDGDFVVQRAKGYATLSDMLRNQSPNPHSPAQQETSHDPYGSRSIAKERYNIDSKEEEMGERGRLSRRGSFHGSINDLNELPAAGMPTRLEKRPLGRSRSRRNSINAEESQLTIENFGGSQDNLNYATRNPDKEPYIHTGRRDSAQAQEGSPRARDNSGSRSRSVERRMDLHRPSVDEIDNRLVDKLERDALEREKRVPRRDQKRHEIVDTSSDSDAPSYEDDKPISKATSFKELSRLKEQLPGGINIIYMQPDKDEQPPSKGHSKVTEKKTTFAALPNQTTWKQQGSHSHAAADDDKTYAEGGHTESQVMSSELHNVRLKLEEKRKKIEADKRKMEQMINKERQKLGKEAFMQAVVKGGKGSSTGSSTPTTTTSESASAELLIDSVERSLSATSPPQQPSSIKTESNVTSLPQLPTSHPHSTPLAIPHPHSIPLVASHSHLSSYQPCNSSKSSSASSARPRSILSLQDVGAEVSNVSKKWLDRDVPMEELRTPDIDAMDYDEYQKSLTQMTDSLTEIQSDIQRLNHQQHQIQSMMQNGISSQAPNAPQPHEQFYLHDQGSPSRRGWSHPASSDGYASMSPATRRAQWGPVRPMMPHNEFMMHPQQQQGNYYSYQMPQQMGPQGPAPHQLPPINQMGPQQSQSGFLLHTQAHSLPGGQPQPHGFQNGQGGYFPPEQYRQYPAQGVSYGEPLRGPGTQGPNVPFRLHTENGPSEDQRMPPSLQSSAHSSPSHQTFHRQQKSPSPSSSRQAFSHAPVAAPPPDDMEPQNVCFIDSENAAGHETNEDKLKRLSLTSGSRTYRISHEPGSPTRPQLGTKTFRVPTRKGHPVDDRSNLPEPSPPVRTASPSNDDRAESPFEDIQIDPLQDGSKPEKGFYISLDDDSGPKRPKPTLRAKKFQRKTSTPTTPLSTPSREDPPPIPERPPRRSNANGPLDKSGSGASLLQRESNRNSMTYGMTSPTYPSPLATFPSRSDITVSPSSSTSSVPQRPSVWKSQSASNDDSIYNTPYEQFSKNNTKYFGDDSGDDSRLATSEGVTFVSKEKGAPSGTALVIGDELVNPDSALSEMEKKKEKLMMASMRRKQQQEEVKRKKEIESELRRDEEKLKEDVKLKKKEDEKARRELILEKHKIKRAIEEAEKEGRHYTPPAWYFDDASGAATSKSSSVRMRHRGPGAGKPRPKTMHEASFGDSDVRLGSIGRNRKGSSQNLSDSPGTSSYLRKNSGRWGSTNSLSRATGSRGSTGSIGPDYSGRSSRTPDFGHSGRRPNSVMGTGSGSLIGRERSKPSRHGEPDSLLYHMSEDSGLGRATPPRRAPSPGMSSRHLPSPSGPGSLPPGLFSRRRPGGGVFDDNASDVSVSSSNMDYCGPRLFKQPAAKSNRPIVLNSVEYCVFPGAVNQSAKQRVLEEIARSESKHFLILFRDSGCQFRAIYSFNPETEEVHKLFGTGPKQVNERMYDKFFKYNSGGKCFSEIHTKHLTVTIDAFTIHNSLWQGKKVNLPLKKDMKLVI